MVYEAAKDILRQSDSPEGRTAAVARAMDLGMPLWAIEAYLDQLEAATDSLARDLSGDPPSIDPSPTRQSK